MLDKIVLFPKHTIFSRNKIKTKQQLFIPACNNYHNYE